MANAQIDDATGMDILTYLAIEIAMSNLSSIDISTSMANVSSKDPKNFAIIPT